MCLRYTTVEHSTDEFQDSFEKFNVRVNDEAKGDASAGKDISDIIFPAMHNSWKKIEGSLNANPHHQTIVLICEIESLIDVDVTMPEHAYHS